MSRAEMELKRLQKEYDKLVNKPVKTEKQRKKKLEDLDHLSQLMFEIREMDYFQTTGVK